MDTSSRNNRFPAGILTYIYMMLAILLLSGCNHHSKTAETTELDSLSTQCYNLLQNLKTKELRSLASEYLHKAPKGSKQYYEARLFYINSYFNEKNYPHTLELLEETVKDPDLARLPASCANYLYTEARCHQFSQQYPEAIATFRKMLDLKPAADTDDADKELLYKLHIGAMMQTMYSYYFAGKTQDGFKAFVALDRECPAYISAHYKRDLLSVFSYAAFLANKMDTARILIDQALALPTYNDSRENRCRDYNFAAEIYRTKEAKRETAIRYFEESLRISQEDQSIPGEQYVMTTLGNLYDEQGHYTKSIQFYKTAYKVACRRNDTNAAASAYISLAQFYNRYELTKEATFYINEALALASVRNNYQQLGQALKLKATLLRANRPDSAFCLLDSAAICFERGQLETEWLETQLSKAGYLIDASTPDSLAAGEEVLRTIRDRKFTEAQQTNYKFLLMRSLDKTGQTGEALLLGKQLEKDITKDSPINQQYTILHDLIDIYTREGQPDKVMALTTRWRPTVAAKLGNDITRYMASAHIQYQTELKEQQLHLLKAELQIKQLSIAVYIAIILFLLSVIAWGLLWWRQRRKELRNLFEQLIRRHLEWKDTNRLPAGEEIFILPDYIAVQEETADTDPEKKPSPAQHPDPAQQSLVYRRVLTVMQKEKPFLNPAFDLNMLARHVGTNRTMLSTTLNRETGTNFNNWLAEYRVNYLIEQLPLHTDKSVNELYPLVGFSSRTTFFRQFRQVTGITPNQYLALQTKTSQE